tara:strand:+ start:5781 stop:7409 length:1629 start_codon:yes stop_codon:yes gene_type:complete
MRFNKFKKMYRDIIYVSRITKVKNKKLRIILTVVLANLVAAVDIGLILVFSAVIANSFQSDNILSFIVELFLDNKYLIPLLVVVRFVFVYAQTINMKSLELEIHKNLRVHLLKEVFDKSNYSVSDAYFYVNELTGHITFFYGALTAFFMSLIQIFAYGYYLFDSNYQVLFFFLGGILLLYFPLLKIIEKSRSFTDKSYWMNLSLSKEIEKIVENMFLIKILNKDKNEIDNFENTVANINSIDLKNIIWKSFSGFLPTFLTMFVLGVLISFESIVKSLTLDFIGVTLRLFQQLGALSNSFNNLLNSQIHIEHFANLDKNKASVNRDNYIADSEEYPKLAVKIDSLSFKYFNSEEYIFKNITCEIKRNEHTLITGANGTGKSTLLGLIAGVLVANEGKIHVTSSKFGYIGATPFIFNNSLRENLVYGNENKIADEVLLSKLHEFDLFKEESSYDLDRLVSNKSLSSGQMQKIAFIRALIGGIDILLLDESTSNLDTKTKDFIFNILENEKITIINSTHDPAMFKNANNHIKVEIIDEERKLIVN